MKIDAGRALLRLLAWIPLRLQRGIAGIVAALLRASGWRKLEVIDRNVAVAFPELERARRRRLVRANLRAVACTAMECGPLWHRDRDWIESRLIAAHGLEHLERARRAGRGVLVLGGHLGNWELSILFGSLRMPIDYLYKPPRSARVDALLTRCRSRFGATMVPTGGAAMRRVVRSLASGGNVGLLFDQLPKGGDFVTVPFFGRPAATMTLPHRLIRSTGCGVVMGHCLRCADGRGWRARFDPVPGADDPDPARALTAMNSVLESLVRAAPEQYLWQYRRFEPLSNR